MQTNVEEYASDSDDSEFETASEADSDDDLDQAPPPEEHDWRVLPDVVLPLTGVHLRRYIRTSLPTCSSLYESLKRTITIMA